jgi:hypothetical protein
MLRRALSWQNAWRIRMVALALITLLVGVGSQVLVNTFANETPDIAITVSSHASEGSTAARNSAHPGACSFMGAHLSSASLIADRSLVRYCTSEGNHHTSSAAHLHLILPANNPGPMPWIDRHLSGQLHQTPPDDAAHPYDSPR